MFTAQPSAAAAAPLEAERNLALLCYGLLFFAIFFAGAPALVAVAIAYARKRRVDPGVASHHRFQIVIFWVGFVLTVMAAVAGMVAAFSVLADLVGTVVRVGLSHWGALQIAEIPIGHTFFTAIAAAMVLGAATGLWLWIASAYGFVRLATGRAIRQTAR